MEKSNASANENRDNLRGVISPAAVYGFFVAGLLDAALCRRLFLDVAHGRGPHCPECGNDIDDKLVQAYYSFDRFLCKHCGKQPRATKGTILHNSPLSASQFIMLAALLAMGRTVKEISQKTELSKETVRIWKRKLNGQ